MTYYERVNELRDNTNFTPENYELEYLTTEVVLADLFGEYIKGAEVNSTSCGTGRVTEIAGDTLETTFMTVAFEDSIKKFAVLPIITGRALFTKFADITEIGDAWDAAFKVHTELTEKYSELKRAEELRKKEAAKRAEAEKKAEAKYQHLKEKAVKDFEVLTTKVKETITEADEFYYALGWLAKHTSTISAALPDYLASSFTKHFGTDTGARIVDSKKKTINGYSMQWTFGFKAALRKSDDIPAILMPYVSSSGKAIANTSFIWDLVESYGFKFGKKQDIDHIKKTIPAQCMSSFEAGLSA